MPFASRERAPAEITGERGPRMRFSVPAWGFDPRGKRGGAAEAAPLDRLPMDRQGQTHVALYGSMSGKVAVSVLLPDVIVSVTSVKVTPTNTGVI